MKKKNLKFENIIKLNISLKYRKKAAKKLKVSIGKLKIQFEEEDFITVNGKNIILFLCFFQKYMQVFIIFNILGNMLISIGFSKIC